MRLISIDIVGEGEDTLHSMYGDVERVFETTSMANWNL